MQLDTSSTKSSAGFSRREIEPPLTCAGHNLESRVRDEEERAEYVESLESIRQETKEISDTDVEQRETPLINSFRNDVLPGLVHTVEQTDVDISNILAHDTAFKTFDGFVTQFPTYYCHLDLILGRDFH